MSDLSHLDNLANEINFYKNQSVQNIIEIGNRLIVAKEQVDHGEWESWLNSNVDFTARQARRFMQVSREMPNWTTSAHLTVSKVFEILTLPEETREDFIATNDVEDMTTRELREAIQKQKQLESEIEVLKASEPKVVEKVSVKEVIPPEYLKAKRELDELLEDGNIHRLEEENQRMRKEAYKLVSENERLKAENPQGEHRKKVNQSVMTLSTTIANFLDQVGGSLWVSDYFEEMSSFEKKIYEKGINSLYGFAMTALENIKEVK